MAPLTGTVNVFGEEMPLNAEALVLGVAEKLNAPGLGRDVFGTGRHLIREEDLYLRMVANAAFGDKEDGSDKVAAADVEEMRLFEVSRKHLPKSVFDAKRWKKVVGPDLWPHVVYMLNRGGRFQKYQEAFKNGQLANRYDKMIGLYFEKFVSTHHSMTGI